MSSTVDITLWCRNVIPCCCTALTCRRHVSTIFWIIYSQKQSLFQFFGLFKIYSKILSPSFDPLIKWSWYRDCQTKPGLTLRASAVTDALNERRYRLNVGTCLWHVGFARNAGLGFLWVIGIALSTSHSDDPTINTIMWIWLGITTCIGISIFELNFEAFCIWRSTILPTYDKIISTFTTSPK